MIKGPKKTISVVVPEEMYAELNALTKEASRPLSVYVRQVLKAHLEYMRRFKLLSRHGGQS